MTNLPTASLVLGVAFVLDAVIGEPPIVLHPVVWMGYAIRPLKRLRAMRPALEFVVGALYVVFTCALFGTGAWLIRMRLGSFPIAQFLFDVYVVWSCFALRGLVLAGRTLRHALEENDLNAARAALSSLCSRTADDLSETELAGAAIESLAENTSDSVVAPFLYYVLFGVPGIVVYRVANTFDAMVGYRGRFEYVGKFAARLDDVLNLVPARLTALLILASGTLLSLDVRGGVATWLRDRFNTESPNAGHPMAMAAGLLGVALDKRGAYVLGANGAPPSAGALRRTESLTKCTGGLACLLAIVMIRAFFGGVVVD